MMQLSLADQESRFLCYCVSFPYFLNFWVWGRVEEPRSDILSIELVQILVRSAAFAIRPCIVPAGESGR